MPSLFFIRLQLQSRKGWILMLPHSRWPVDSPIPWSSLLEHLHEHCRMSNILWCTDVCSHPKNTLRQLAKCLDCTCIIFEFFARLFHMVLAVSISLVWWAAILLKVFLLFYRCLNVYGSVCQPVLSVVGWGLIAALPPPFSPEFSKQTNFKQCTAHVCRLLRAGMLSLGAASAHFNIVFVWSVGWVSCNANKKTVAIAYLRLDGSNMWGTFMRATIHSYQITGKGIGVDLCSDW
jgi:hypothetical protein